MTTKLKRVECDPLLHAREFTFVLSEKAIQAIADKDEHATLLLLETLGELMQEVQAFARGEHPRINNELNDQYQKELRGFYEKKYAPDPDWLQKKKQIQNLIDSLKAAGMWPPKP